MGRNKAAIVAIQRTTEIRTVEATVSEVERILIEPGS